MQFLQSVELFYHERRCNFQLEGIQTITRRENKRRNHIKLCDLKLVWKNITMGQNPNNSRSALVMSSKRFFQSLTL